MKSSKNIHFQAKKNSKKSEKRFFVKLLHINCDGSGMVPERVPGREVSHKSPRSVIWRFIIIIFLKIDFFDFKNGFFQDLREIEARKHDFRSLSKPIGFFAMSAQVKPSQGNVKGDLNQILAEPILD